MSEYKDGYNSVMKTAKIGVKDALNIGADMSRMQSMVYPAMVRKLTDLTPLKDSGTAALAEGLASTLTAPMRLPANLRDLYSPNVNLSQQERIHTAMDAIKGPAVAGKGYMVGSYVTGEEDEE